MKKTIIAILFLIQFSDLTAQEPVINFGYSYPVFFEKDFDDSGASVTIGPDRLHLFAEMPHIIKFRKNPNFSITPGTGYFLFNEYDESDGSALGGGSYKTLNHQALSLYTRVNYTFSLNPEKTTKFYTGFLTGFYVYSKSNGHIDWWRLEQSGYRNGTYKIENNGKPFFNNFYSGFFAGVRFKTGFCKWMQPSFEVSFMPGYASLPDNSYFGDSDKSSTKSMMMFTLILGLGQKKATQRNE